MIIAQPICTLLLTPDLLAKMKSFYKGSAVPNNNPYVDMFAREESVSITIYKPNKKGLIKAVFQGPRAVDEAKTWDPNAWNEMEQPLPPEPMIRKAFANIYPQIGSDEVGTGDFFGPICVCAAFVREEDLPDIEAFGITDSKLMTDEHIREIGPKIIKRFAYSQMSLPNEKYNEVHEENNMNKIKARMHNACVLNLLDKFPNTAVYQDQFAEEKLYYKYLKDEPRVAKGITFSTKGEKAFPSVALGSVIARYSFLRKMDELNEKYGMKFPFGAGEAVDEFAKKFVKKFGLEEIKKVAKCNFANFKKLV